MSGISLLYTVIFGTLTIVVLLSTFFLIINSDPRVKKEGLKSVVIQTLVGKKTIIKLPDEKTLLHRLKNVSIDIGKVGEKIVYSIIAKQGAGEMLGGNGVWYLVRNSIVTWAKQEHLEIIFNEVLVKAPILIGAIVGKWHPLVLQDALHWYRSDMVEVGCNPKIIEQTIQAALK